jgi:cytochrome c oxidase subunit 2
MMVFSRYRASIKRLAAGLLLLLIATGCAGSPSTFAPASTNAGLIKNLTIILFSIAATVFVVVEGVLIYTTIHYRGKDRKDFPRQVEGNQRFEIAWTIVPAVILLAVFLVSLRTLRTLGYQPDPPANVINVRVVGHQWWWEFDYPDLNITTANELYVPVNTIVNIDVESVDVIHSFWAPQLGPKIDAIPGHTNKTWFEATQTGEYHGQCSEYCGAEHGKMLFDVYVDTSDQFQAWVKNQQAPIPQMTGQAALGEQEFMKAACVGCHTINGTAAQGKVGPNLTHLGSRFIFAGGVGTNTYESMQAWLADPQAIKPGTLMPNLHLSQSQINDIVTFLVNLK